MRRSDRRTRRAPLLVGFACVTTGSLVMNCGCQNVSPAVSGTQTYERRVPWQDSIGPPQDTRVPTTPQARAEHDMLEERVGGAVVSAFWLPYFKVRGDRDDEVVGPGGVFRADLDAGDGWGARLGFGPGDSNVGILYLTSQHDERETDAHVRTHSAYVEYWGEKDAELSDNSDLFFGAGLGVGGAVFEFSRTFDDSGGAAIEGRVATGVRISEFLRLEIGGALFLWGYPGETIGTGGFFTLGGSLLF